MSPNRALFHDFGLSLSHCTGSGSLFPHQQALTSIPRIRDKLGCCRQPFFPFCLFFSLLFFLIFLNFFSSLLQGTAKPVTALSFTEMIPSCQNVLEEVHLPVSLSPKAVSEHGLTLCDPRQSGGVLRALGRRNFLAQLSAMKVNR